MGTRGDQRDRSRRYRKDCSYLVNVGDNKLISAKDVITAVEGICGVGTLYACVPKANDSFEITLDDKASGLLISDGLVIGVRACPVSEIVKSFLMVSFLHIPAYIEDEEILMKLGLLGVTILSPVKRRFYPNTTVADGTRFVKVRLPPELPSIPYTVKLDNSYYRVVHDNQKKMCNLCHSLDHVFKDCPDFSCFKCKGQGHYARNCTTPPCTRCGSTRMNCRCDEVPSLCEKCGECNPRCTCTDESEEEGDRECYTCDTCEQFICVCKTQTHNIGDGGVGDDDIEIDDDDGDGDDVDKGLNDDDDDDDDGEDDDDDDDDVDDPDHDELMNGTSVVGDEVKLTDDLSVAEEGSLPVISPIERGTQDLDNNIVNSNVSHDVCNNGEEGSQSTDIPSPPCDVDMTTEENVAKVLLRQKRKSKSAASPSGHKKGKKSKDKK